MLKPPKQESMDPDKYERVPVNEFVNGVIEDVEHDPNHQFKGPHAKAGEAVRLKFKIDGLEFPHRTRWMTFSYSEKSNLYTKYIVKLVEGAKPFMDFDLHRLKGMKVRMFWENDARDPRYQSIQVIVPQGQKISASSKAQGDETVLF